MVRFGLRWGVMVVAVLASATSALSQVSPLDIFGGVLAAAQIQAAREAWARLPPAERFCLQRALAGQNLSLNAYRALLRPHGLYQAPLPGVSSVPATVLFSASSGAYRMDAVEKVGGG